MVSLTTAAADHPPNGEALILDGREPMSGRLAIINPEELGAPRGWNNGMLAAAGGRTLFIAGQTARDGSGRVPAADFVSQFDRALGNVLTVLREAGGEPGHIGRFTIYVTDMAQYRASLKDLGEVYRRRMGDALPGNGAGGGDGAGGRAGGGGDRGDGGAGLRSASSSRAKRGNSRVSGSNPAGKVPRFARDEDSVTKAERIDGA